jgi:NAD(P)-dependent dehydrogenase (short-subunit alcohol dehydrogenase family)
MPSRCTPATSSAPTLPGNACPPLTTSWSAIWPASTACARWLGRAGRPDLDDLQWAKRRWDAAQAYSDSKLFDVVLAFAVARRWPAVLSNALEPGWVPTKMGGPGAPDDLSLAPVTQAWLAVSAEPAATVTGSYFYHQRPRDVNPAARSAELQDGLLDRCASLAGVAFPNTPTGLRNLHGWLACRW